MKTFRHVGLMAIAAAGLFVATAHTASAQVSVEIGAAPVCPYGYYEEPPYNCAPYGFYGPEWFSGGIFIGAGPWFHGPGNFYGHVDHHLDYRKGYHGPLPARGEHAVEHPKSQFRGKAMHDPHGHRSEERRGGVGR